MYAILESDDQPRRRCYENAGSHVLVDIEGISLLREIVRAHHLPRFSLRVFCITTEHTFSQVV